MKINQIINEGQVFYAKNPDGTKTYALVKDAEHLANLEQKYSGAQVQTLDFARQDVQDWLDSRGVNLRRFPPGMETTVGPNQGRPADAPTKPQNVVWRAPGYEPGKGSPFDTSGSTLIKRTNFPAKDDAMAEGDGDHQIRPGMKVSQGTVVKVDGNTVVVKTSNGDMMTMNIHDIQQGMAEGLNEFAPAGRDPWGDDQEPGDDPYKSPKPKAYGRSIDYFGQFEADHFDKEDMDDTTGVFKGYWDYDGDMKQIAYFKFDNPTATGSDDPGMGWYYEPQNESVAEGMGGGEYGRVLDALKLYYPRVSMEELNVPGYHKVIANKANVPVEYAAQVINDFVKANDPNDDEEWPENDEQGVAEGIEGEIAGGVVGSVVGGAAGSTLGPIGGAIGSALGGSVGSAIGSRYQDGKPLKEKQQLDEIAPLLAAGARLFMAAAPKIAQVVGRTGRAGAQGAGQTARAGAEIAAKNAGQIGLGAGAYQIGASVADIAKDITAKVGQAVDEKTIFELATLAFKYAIPAGIVLAIMYGGKKAIDSLFSDKEPKPGVAEGKPKEKEADYGPDYQDMVARLKKLAGLGPLRTVYDPVKRVYRNVPTAVQPKKEQR